MHIGIFLYIALSIVFVATYGDVGGGRGQALMLVLLPVVIFAATVFYEKRQK